MPLEKHVEKRIDDVRDATVDDLLGELPKLSDRALMALWRMTMDLGPLLQACQGRDVFGCGGSDMYRRNFMLETAIIKRFKRPEGE